MRLLRCRVVTFDSVSHFYYTDPKVFKYSLVGFQTKSSKVSLQRKIIDASVPAEV